MPYELLKFNWIDAISDTLDNGYMIRISPECIPDLFIGQTKTNNRCLILSLPKEVELDFNNNTKENLSIEYLKQRNYLVITLLNSSYIELFDDFIFSIYQKVYKLSDPRLYSKQFIDVYYKWSDFFQEGKEDILSIDTIKGLYGELFLLRRFLLNSDLLNVNSILESWRGPYDAGHDFVMDEIDIEVKTKEETRTIISISSEYQLERDKEKNLELKVLSTKLDTVNGLSIGNLLFEIKDMINEKNGNIEILYKALKQKGLTATNIKIYDNYRFIATEIITYDCCDPFFPSLVRSNINPAVFSISYKLNLNDLNNFIITKEKISVGN